MNHRLYSNHGSVFLSTMVCALLMSVVGGSMYQLTTYESHLVNRLRKATQAQQLAEAGLSRALATAYTNWSALSGGFSSVSLGNGSYLTSVVTSGGRYLLKTTGTVQGTSSTASAEVAPPVVSALNYVFAGGSTGNHVIDTGSGNSPGTVIGDIYMGGPLTIDGPSHGGSLAITGNVYDLSTVSSGSHGNYTVSGTTNQNWTTTVVFPTVDFNFYQTIAQANGQYFSGNKTYSSGTIPASPAGGVIFVNGNVTINGTQNTTACIVATGNISMAKSGSTYPRITINQYSNYPALLTQNGSISYTSTGNGGAYLRTTGLVYSGNNFSLSSGNHDDFSFTGSVLARGTFNTSGLTAFNSTLGTYVAQSPPGMTLTGNTYMSIVSYNQ